MRVEVFRHFADAEASSLKVELFRDRDLFVRAWYIGPLIRMAKEFVLPFAPREQNLRAETAIAQVVEIALSADLPVALIDPQHLLDELPRGHRRADLFSALLDPAAEDRRWPDQLVARRGRAAEPRRHRRGASRASSRRRRSPARSDDVRREPE